MTLSHLFSEQDISWPEFPLTKYTRSLGVLSPEDWRRMRGTGQDADYTLFQVEADTSTVLQKKFQLIHQVYAPGWNPDGQILRLGFVLLKPPQQ